MHTGTKSKLNLLAAEKLIKTGPVDHAEWNHRPILGNIQRLRFSLALSLLPDWSARILEIGYGSGIFLPALKARAHELYGVDIHDKADEVNSLLANEGIETELFRAQAEELPFNDGFFDTVVAVSSLEFVSDLTRCCEEIRRVLRADGVLVVVTPAQSVLVDLGLRLLTGKSAMKDFGDSRRLIIPTLLQSFEVRARTAAPSRFSDYIKFYDALKLSPNRSR